MGKIARLKSSGNFVLSKKWQDEKIILCFIAILRKLIFLTYFNLIVLNFREKLIFSLLFNFVEFENFAKHEEK